MFRLNYWSRPLLNNNHHSSGLCPPGPSNNTCSAVGPGNRPSATPIDYTAARGGTPGNGSYLPLSMAASPALMVLASNGQQDASPASATALALQAARAAAARSSTSNLRSDDDTKESAAASGLAGHHHHAAFGSTPPFPFYRNGQGSGAGGAGNTQTAADAAAGLSSSSTSLQPHHHHQHQLPPLFSHLHHSLLRSHLDSAAVQAAAAHIQHQARLGAAAIFGQRLASAAAAMAAVAASHVGSPGNGYRSAFAPAASRKSSSSSGGSRNTSLYHGGHPMQQQQQPQHYSQGLSSPALLTVGRSRRYSGDERPSQSDDEQTYCGGVSDVIAKSLQVSVRGPRYHVTCGNNSGGRRTHGGCSPHGDSNQQSEVVEDDGVRHVTATTTTGSPCSPGLSCEADSDMMSDQMSSVGDRITPNMEHHASSGFKGIKYIYVFCQFIGEQSCISYRNEVARG